MWPSKNIKTTTTTTTKASKHLRALEWGRNFSLQVRFIDQNVWKAQNAEKTSYLFSLPF